MSMSVVLLIIRLTESKMCYNYLCTYDLYGPVRKVFDAGRYITWGKGGGGLALEISSFVGPCEICARNKKKLKNSLRQ
jgi:hypothetical protein